MQAAATTRGPYNNNETFWMCKLQYMIIVSREMRFYEMNKQTLVVPLHYCDEDDGMIFRLLCCLCMFFSVHWIH
jgi:hypothetical protein